MLLRADEIIILILLIIDNKWMNRDDEYLDSILEDMHYTTVNGVKSCVPGGVNVLSTAFNTEFYFKGIGSIGSFLIVKARVV